MAVAVPWRVEVEAIEGMQAKPTVTEELEMLGDALGQELRPQGNALAPALRNVVIEISAGRGGTQRTKPVDVPGSGSMQLSKVLFVAAPAPGETLVVRAIRVSGASPDILLGEAQLPALPGRRRLELTRGGLVAGSLVLSLMQGMPSAPQVHSGSMSMRQALAGPLAAGALGFPKDAGNSTLQEQEEDKTLPPGWRCRFDASHGAFYYFRVDVEGAPDASSVRWSKPAPASAALMAASAELRSGQSVAGAASSSSASAAASFAGVGAPRSEASSSAREPLSSPPLSPSPKKRPSPTPSVTSSSASRPGASSSRPGASSRTPAASSGPARQQQQQQQQQQVQQQPQQQHDSHSWAAPPASSGRPPLQRSAVASAASQAARAAAAIARDARADQDFRDARPLRQRSPMLPVIGTCDATIEALDGLTPPLQNPRLIIGLEGQEFRVEKRELKAGPLQYTLPFASLGSNLQLLCYDCPGDGEPPDLVGRILVPLTDTAHPTGEPMSLGHVWADRCRDEAALLRRRYHLQFLPGPFFDLAQEGDPAFADRFTATTLAAALRAPRASAEGGSSGGGGRHGTGGAAASSSSSTAVAAPAPPWREGASWSNGCGGGGGGESAFRAGVCAFGSVSLIIELALQPEVAKPMSLYWASVACGIQQAVHSGAPPRRPPWAPAMGPMGSPMGGGGAWPGLHQRAAPGMEAAAAAQWFRSEGLAGMESVFHSLRRILHFWISPSQGWSRWLRSAWWHGPVAALAWLVFCVRYFPPPLWTWPLYLWLWLLLDGLLAAGHRRSDWRGGGGRALAQLDIEEGSLQRELKSLGLGRCGGGGGRAAAGTSSAGQGRRRAGSSPRREELEEEEEEEEEEEADEDASEASSSSAGMPRSPAMSEETRLQQLAQQLARFEPMLSEIAGFLERGANLTSFADGTASAIGYLFLGAIVLFISLVLLLVTWLDPSFGFAVGVDGAITIVLLSRTPLEKPEEPFGWQRKLNQIMACVPDEAELVHRLVATKVQRLSKR